MMRRASLSKASKSFQAFYRAVVNTRLRHILILVAIALIVICGTIAFFSPSLSANSARTIEEDSASASEARAGKGKQSQFWDILDSKKGGATNSKGHVGGRARGGGVGGGIDAVSGANQRRKVYIDVGAYDGDTLRLFLDLVPNKEEWELFAFECSHGNLQRLPDKMKEGKYKPFFNQLTIIPKCAGTQNKTTKFLGRDTSGRVDGSGRENIKTIDLSEWMLNHLAKEDLVVLKMDIEGGEFDVIPHLIENGALDLVDKLQLETHAWLLRGISKEKEKFMLENLDRQGLIYRFATYDVQVATETERYDSWEDPPKYILESEYPKPGVDLHFSRDGVDWIKDWI